MSVAEKNDDACKRQNGRRRTLFGGVVFSGDGESECFISDISTSGVRVRLKDPIEMGSEVDLKINKFEFLLKAKVVWIRDGYTGLEFKNPLNPKDANLSRLFSLIGK